MVNYEEMPASGVVDRLLLATEEKKDETMGCPEANTAKEQELRARPEENANEPNASRDVDESVTDESREQDRSECVGFPGEQERRSRSQDRGGHDASGSGDRFGCILMMTSGVEHDLPPDASVATKLSSLSQRLSLLRRSLHGDYDSCGCSSGRRSSSRRVVAAHIPGNRKGNQHAVWVSCKRCGLRMGYEFKGQMTGQYRSLGAPPEMIAMAQEELRQNFAASEMNEKIFAGKLLELRGRTLVANRGQGTTQVDVKANQNPG